MNTLTIEERILKHVQNLFPMPVGCDACKTKVENKRGHKKQQLLKDLEGLNSFQQDAKLKEWGI